MQYTITLTRELKNVYEFIVICMSLEFKVVFIRFSESFLFAGFVIVEFRSRFLTTLKNEDIYKK